MNYELSDIQQLSSGMTLLYVEDDEGIIELFQEILEIIFSRVVVAHNGKEGLELFHTLKPDIVMTDIYMPLLDGLEMATLIKEYDRSTPVIVTSAYSQSDEFLRSIEIGVDGYVVKPFSKTRLFNALGRVLEGMSSTKKVKEYHHLVENIISHVADGVVVTNPMTQIVMVNPAMCSMMGYEEFEMIGAKPSLYRSYDHEDTFYQKMWGQIHEQGEWEGEMINRRKDGTMVIIYLTIIAMRDCHGEIVNYIGTCRDITHQKHTMDEVAYKATHDPLTGAYNRQYLESLSLDDEVHPYALMVVDVDGFKQVNDHYGHAMGDKVLVALAKGLEEIVRKSDVVIRYGGDEFVVVLIDMQNPELIGLIAKRMLAFVEQLNFTMLKEITIGISIGIEFSKTHGKNFQEVYELADRAMYHVKEHGKNSYLIASEEESVIIR